MIPLPGAALQLLPFFQWTRAPSRFMVVTMLALAVLAGFGLARIRQATRGHRWLGLPAPSIATALAGALILFEFCVVPFPTTPIAVPDFYRRLAQEPGDFAILDLPIQPYQLQPQFLQTFHGKRLVYAHLSRIPEERFAYLDSIAGQVYHPTGALQAANIRYLLLHTDQLPSLEPAEAESLQAALDANFQLIEHEDDLRVYRAYPIRGAP